MQKISIKIFLFGHLFAHYETIENIHRISFTEMHKIAIESIRIDNEITAASSFSKRNYSQQRPATYAAANAPSYGSDYSPAGEEDDQSDYQPSYGPPDTDSYDSGNEADQADQPCEGRKHGPCRHRTQKQAENAYQAPAYEAPAATTTCTTGMAQPTTTPTGELPNSVERPSCTTQTVTKTTEKIVPTTVTETKTVEKPVTDFRTKTVEHVATVTKEHVKTETATVTTTTCETVTATRTVEHAVTSTTTCFETKTATATVDHTMTEVHPVTKTEMQKEYVTKTVTETIKPTPQGQLPFEQEKTPYGPVTPPPPSAYGPVPPAGQQPAKEDKAPVKYNTSQGDYGYTPAGSAPSSDNTY